MLLAGDIGGTKPALGVYTPERGPRSPLVRDSFPSDDYPSLEAVVSAFLARHDVWLDSACFDVAGPVVGGRAKVTNLPWSIEAEALRRKFGLRAVHLLNDLEALAQAVPQLGPGDLNTISKGKAVPGGSIAVVAPGTGLGEAYLTWDGRRYRAHPSEGGHSDFAPAGEVEDGLLRFLRGRYGHVSTERVVSGLGISNIYDYLVDTDLLHEEPDVAARMEGVEDRTPIIVEAGVKGTSALCEAALELFVNALGAEVSNMALKVLSTGGIYLGGGIPPRIVDVLKRGEFMESFLDKGRMREVLEPMPVHVILMHDAALMGAASYGLLAGEQEDPVG
jgi:glucokinase